MLKSKFKLFSILFFVIIFLNSVVFATESVTNGDIYVKNSDSIEIKEMILGNAFVSTKDFTLFPTEDGGIITGNLFVISDNVSLQSDVTYSEDGKVEAVNISSKIFGNAYIIADKFKLEPGSSIEGDLYIIANEVEIDQSSVIYGNTFIISDSVNLSGQVAGNTYINCKNFNMNYNGLILQDLYLSSESATLSGMIRRSAFINSNNVTTNSDYIVYSNLEIESPTINFSGEVKGDANFIGKNINLNSSSSIVGNLNYTTKNELNISSEIVTGEINFSKLNSFEVKKIIPKIISFTSLLVYCLAFYFVTKKFFSGFMDKLSNFKAFDILKFLGFGVLLFIVFPILIGLLFLVKIGYLLAFILLAIYMLLLSLSIPTFVTGFSEFINSKFSKLPSWLYVIILSILLYGLSYIPFAGLIIILLEMIIGIGMIVKK